MAVWAAQTGLAGEFSGFALKPESVILAEEAWFEGQAVGAVVAAETEEIAKEALGYSCGMGAAALCPGSGRGAKAGCSCSSSRGRKQQT